MHISHEYISKLANYAPFVDIKPRAHVNAPWYDRHCQQATRRLERVYRRDKTDANREAWKRQSKSLDAATDVRELLVDYDRSQIA